MRDWDQSGAAMFTTRARVGAVGRAGAGDGPLPPARGVYPAGYTLLRWTQY